MESLAANSFPRRSLMKHQTRALFHALYPCPPDVRVGHGFTIGCARVRIPDAPRVSDASWGAEVLAHSTTNSPTSSADPAWDPSDPSNTVRYEAAFKRIHDARWNRWEAAFKRNKTGRNAFWAQSGSSLGYILAHIAAVDQPNLP